MRTLPLALAFVLAACEKPARVEMEPASLRFSAQGQTAKLHAAPYAQNGKPVPDFVCKWSTSDEKVARVSGPHNDATVTAAGPGSATIRCAVDGLTSEVAVAVRIVSRIAVDPPKLDLKVQDAPAPTPLQVDAFDDQGSLVAGKTASIRCEDESVCRGDQRGQIWPVGAGLSKAIVEVDGARAEIPVHVTDARSAALKPRAVRGDPMEEYERYAREREAEEKRKQR
jgi:hypothetical protein